MQLSSYTEKDSAEWDAFLTRAPMATFLHTRRFLSYHGDRFQDASLLLKDEDQKIVGLFPAAADRADSQRVVSHPGTTFGGLVHDGRLYGERIIEALEMLRRYFADAGFKSLRYKAVPYIYHRSPSSDDLYALFRAGAARYRCELSCAIDLTSRMPPSSRRIRGLKKALKSGVEVREGPEYIAPLWRVLEENLQKKYGAKPVHSLDEIKYLHSLFPETVKFVVGSLGAETIAGVVLFADSPVTHVQYVASGEVGYNMCALDAVFERCIEQAAVSGARYFDFGTSNEEEGKYLNTSLYKFKSEFGGGGVAYESYEFDLNS